MPGKMLFWRSNKRGWKNKTKQPKRPKQRAKKHPLKLLGQQAQFHRKPSTPDGALEGPTSRSALKTDATRRIVQRSATNPRQEFPRVCVEGGKRSFPPLNWATSLFKRGCSMIPNQALGTRGRAPHAERRSAQVYFPPPPPFFFLAVVAVSPSVPVTEFPTPPWQLGSAYPWLWDHTRGWAKVAESCWILPRSYWLLSYRLHSNQRGGEGAREREQGEAAQRFWGESREVRGEEGRAEGTRQEGESRTIAESSWDGRERSTLSGGGEELGTVSWGSSGIQQPGAAVSPGALGHDGDTDCWPHPLTLAPRRPRRDAVRDAGQLPVQQREVLPAKMLPC